LAKLFLPLLVKKVVKKAGENFQQQQSQDTSWRNTKSSDEVVYNESNSKKPRETKKVGDYVDYEDID
jgi:spore coat protein CotF